MADPSTNALLHRLSGHLTRLCVDVPDRSVGSARNHSATTYFETELAARGWATETPEFDVID
jgi:hypothetical protein